MVDVKSKVQVYSWSFLSSKTQILFEKSFFQEKNFSRKFKEKLGPEIALRKKLGKNLNREMISFLPVSDE